MVLCWALAQGVQANTLAADGTLQIQLSDGRLLAVSAMGDAQNQWLQTEAGEALVRRQGIWYHADTHGPQVLSTGIPYVTELPQQPAEIPTSTGSDQHVLVGVNDGSSHVAFSFASDQQSYDQPLLLLRVSFLDRKFEYPVQDFQQLMFADDQDEALSVKEYYLENSYQKFRIQPARERQGNFNDGIIDVQLNYNHPNFGGSYGSASKNLVRDALQQADPYIDYDAYDQNRDGLLSANELGVVVMVAGHENAYGGAGAPEPRIWAHKSTVSSPTLDGMKFSFYAMFGEKHHTRIATIGIICHELGHLLFGLPDLYDRKGLTNGVGRWGLMGLGSWNSGAGFSGSSPAHMLAWSKIRSGFLQPKDLQGDKTDIRMNSTSVTPDAARIWLDPFRHSEHFLVEYRTRDNADQGLPGEGLLITHADNWVGVGEYGAQNDVSEHKLVDIEEADGRSDLDQQTNRGDQFDVFNHDYGQSYFGTSSLPASLDYRGIDSGVEITDIRIAQQAKATISLPHKQLGDNLGYDDGGVISPWGSSAGSASFVIRFDVQAAMNYIHGLDIYSHGQARAEVHIYGDLYQGKLQALLLSSKDHNLTRGWNRLLFEDSWDAGQYSQLYVEVIAKNSSGRPFSIDTAGVVSGSTFAPDNDQYHSADFDINGRLLVANQVEAFDYQVPEKVALPSNKRRRSAIGSVFWLLLLFPAIWGARRPAM